MAFGNQEAALLFKIKGDTSDADRALASLDAKTAGLGGSLGGLGATFTVATAAGQLLGDAIRALGNAAVAGTQALWTMTVQAGEYGSRLKDAADKTGLSATSLSALKVAADQSGSSLEQVAGSVSKFSKLVGEAANGSKEAAEKLKLLGVEPQEAIADLDGALAKVFQKIVDAKPGVEQTTLATEAFGKAGADMIPVLRSFDGDMAALIRKAEDLGVVFDDVAAREADEFGDTMDDLGLAVKGLGMTIGRELIPEITDLARSFTQFITNNKAYVQGWAADTVIYLRGVVRAWKEASAAAREYMQWANNASGGAVEGVRSASKPWFMGAALGAGTYLLGDYLYSKGSEYRAADDEGTFIPGERPKPSIFEAPTGGGGGGGRRGGGGGGRTAPKLDGINAVIGAGMDSAAKIEQIKRQYAQALAGLGPDLGQAIKDHAARYGIPEALAFAQIFSESSFARTALSDQGAAGLTQMLPGTASKVLGRKVTAQELIDDPELALTGWAKHMQELFAKYGDWNLAVLAYHQGERTVDELVAKLNAGKGGKGVIGPKGRTYAQRLTALAGSAMTGSGPADALRTMDQTRQAEEKAREDRMKGLKDEGRQMMAIFTARSETELAELKIKLDKGEILNSAYVKRVADIREQELESQKMILETLANNEAASAEDRMDALNELAILDEKIAKQRIENSAAVTAALEAETSATDKLRNSMELKNVGEPFFTGLPGFDTKEKKEGDPGTDGEGIFGGWTRSWKEFFGATTGDGPKLGEMVGQVAKMMQGAFTQIAQGIGSVVQNWVLMGETGPAVMRKLLASTLASLAAEAATRAIFELAAGFAALFFDPAEAAAHFTAAALFGSIAVGSALAGRAIAGDSFKQKTAPAAATGANTQGSRSGSGGAYSTQDQMTVNGGRNAPSGPSGVLVIKDRSGMFDRLFEAAWQNNGPMRRRLMQEFST